MKVFIINLEQCTDRLEQQTLQFQKLDLTFNRLAAVTVNEFSKETYERLAFQGQRPMKQSELACFLSHKKAWQTVLDLKEPCLILEDDAVLVKDLKEILNDIKRLENTDFVNLEVHGRKKSVAKEPRYTVATDYNLFNLYQDRSGTGGYVLFPTGAKKLLDCAEQTHPKLADEFIYGCYTLNAYQIEPAALLQSDKADMYGVDVSVMHESVIGLIKNNHSHAPQNSLMSKFKYKKNRIEQQILLGIHYLKGMFRYNRREIQVDKQRFKLD
ncbi:glycosyltransferase family 25 protein [Acinetobacter boissieri]|uniref:Glycosyl transferase, family 25 n=1 Tax=Acinetobacter boissieri TaxID=1219383 RepID=A0A1G6GFX6_9GAMM|nr:glycosyltransferase family 25 protein [Acinetobacter boissieri]SDB80901.1 glycosyl transferase, family 25 [Acinetobacter boissieri]